jgi:hypothetical protein
MQIAISKEDLVGLLMNKSLDIRQMAEVLKINSNVLEVTTDDYVSLGEKWNVEALLQLDDETLESIYNATKQLHIDTSIAGQLLLATLKNTSTDILVLTVDNGQGGTNLIVVESNVDEYTLGSVLPKEDCDLKTVNEYHNTCIDNSHFHKHMIQKIAKEAKDAKDGLEQPAVLGQTRKRDMSAVDFQQYMMEDHPIFTDHSIDKQFSDSINKIVKANYDGVNTTSFKTNIRFKYEDNQMQEFLNFFKKKGVQVRKVENPREDEYVFIW